MTVVNKRTHQPTSNDVYIGRGSKWGNPFIIGQHGNRTEVIDKYYKYIIDKQELLNDIWELKGKNLVCYCSPLECHGDVLNALRNYDNDDKNSS